MIHSGCGYAAGAAALSVDDGLTYGVALRSAHFDACVLLTAVHFLVACRIVGASMLDFFARVSF